MSEASGPPRLLLVDGHALVYRAFYALQNERPLTSPKGELTSGVYGFTSMLLKAIEDLRPRFVAAAYDTSAPTFRHDASADYKATRAAAPEGLRSQVRLSWKVLEAMGVPIFRVEGFEADDLIGTLATEAARRDIESVILTGDNDLLQLVGPRIKVLTSRRGISDTVLYDEAGVVEKFGGLSPTQIPDFKALRGDTSDNIRGVPGIGDKTAQKLLLEFGSVEGLYAALDRLPEKQRTLLEPLRGQVEQARRLATIVCDVPVDVDLACTLLKDLKRPEVVTIFHDLGFKSLVDRLGRSQSAVEAGAAQLGLFSEAAATSEPEPPARLVTSVEALDRLLAEVRAHGSLAFNVQATGTLPVAADLVGIGVAAGPDVSAYIPLGHESGDHLPREEALKRLRPLFGDPALAKRAHNAKFHMILLARHGVPVEGLAFDTMIAAYLLESGQRALALRDLAWSRLQVELPSVASLLGTGRKAITMAELSAEACGAYACKEASLVERLAPLLEADLAEAGQTTLFRDIEMPLVPVLAAMEQAGVALDLPYLASLGTELQQRLGALEQEIYAAVGHPFNIGSTQQLGQVLFEELGLQVKGRRVRTRTGQLSTGAEVLDELRGTHPVVEHILEHRQLQKLKSTYVDALQALVNPSTGRVHTSFNQTVAATGRLSSSDPNLQNIPVRTDLGKRVRRAFNARPAACLLSADYSQIELRILAHVTDDPTLIEAFAQGEDPHAATAAEVLGIPIEKVTVDQRRLAKTVNYGVLYGMSEYGLAERTDLPPAQAAAFIQRYFERFSTVKQYQDEVIRQTERLGYAETLLGRRRYIPEVRSPYYNVRQAAVRAAINAPIQGTASDIVKIAMIRVYAFLEREAPDVEMLLQVHDELLLEGPEAQLRALAPEVARIMESAMELRARLHVDLKLGPNWEDMHPLHPADNA